MKISRRAAPVECNRSTALVQYFYTFSGCMIFSHPTQSCMQLLTDLACRHPSPWKRMVNNVEWATSTRRLSQFESITWTGQRSIFHRNFLYSIIVSLSTMLFVFICMCVCFFYCSEELFVELICFCFFLFFTYLTEDMYLQVSCIFRAQDIGGVLIMFIPFFLFVCLHHFV